MALAKESETSLRRPSLLLPSIHAHNQLVGFLDFILTKLAILDPLELGSVDGLPPIPVTLSWARDGHTHRRNAVRNERLQSGKRISNISERTENFSFLQNSFKYKFRFQWNFKPTEVGQQLHSAAAPKAVTNM